MATGVRCRKVQQVDTLAAKRLELELLGLLPGVGRVAKVTVRGGLEVDGLLEIELLDYIISTTLIEMQDAKWTYRSHQDGGPSWHG